MIKRIMAFFVILVIATQMAFAVDFPIKVRVNDTFIISEAPVELIDGQSYIVAKSLADAIGVVTNWDEESQTTYLYRQGRRILINEQAISAFEYGAEAVVPEDVKVYQKDGDIYLPLRYLAEFFGNTVTWNGDLKLIDLKSEGVTLRPEVLAQSADLQAELKWLARIINIEARGGSLFKKTAVGNVVMNRVKSPDFPNSVYDVVKQKGQFPPAYYSYFDTFEPNLKSYMAALYALEDFNVIDKCLYFNLKPFSWKPQEDFYKLIEGDYFYY